MLGLADVIATTRLPSVGELVVSCTESKPHLHNVGQIHANPVTYAYVADIKAGSSAKSFSSSTTGASPTGNTCGKRKATETGSGLTEAAPTATAMTRKGVGYSNSTLVRRRDPTWVLAGLNNGSVCTGRTLIACRRVVVPRKLPTIVRLDGNLDEAIRTPQRRSHG